MPEPTTTLDVPLVEQIQAYLSDTQRITEPRAHQLLALAAAALSDGGEDSNRVRAAWEALSRDGSVPPSPAGQDMALAGSGTPGQGEFRSVLGEAMAELAETGNPYWRLGGRGGRTLSQLGRYLHNGGSGTPEPRTPSEQDQADAGFLREQAEDCDTWERHDWAARFRAIADRLAPEPRTGTDPSQEVQP